MPTICPQPPHPEDCPLYDRRLAYGSDEPLRRAILTEKPRPSLGQMVWADFQRECRRPSSPGPTRPALPPPPEPTPLPIGILHQEAPRHE